MENGKVSKALWKNYLHAHDRCTQILLHHLSALPIGIYRVINHGNKVTIFFKRMKICMNIDVYLDMSIRWNPLGDKNSYLFASFNSNVSTTCNRIIFLLSTMGHFSKSSCTTGNLHIYTMRGFRGFTFCQVSHGKQSMVKIK